MYPVSEDDRKGEEGANRWRKNNSINRLLKEWRRDGDTPCERQNEIRIGGSWNRE
jgi:hypothetical protein